MTLTKELLRAARVDYERIQIVTRFYDFEDMRIDNVHRFAAAARFVERLLPETCDACNLDQCEDCHGSGQLWDEGLVEVVAEALHDAPYDGCDNYQQMQVRAVLAALAAEAQR